MVYTYASTPAHGVSLAERTSDSADLTFGYDANGNMAQRQYFDSTGVTRTQVLAWDAANQLAVVTQTTPSLVSQYWYDGNGTRYGRLQADGSSTTFTASPFPFFDVEWSQPGNSWQYTTHYLLNGQAIAFGIDDEEVTYLYRDQVGSVMVLTSEGVITDTRQYYAYGSKRGGDELPVDANYTEQRLDGTGLLYYGARYYDPELGLFISPDTLIPDPTDIFSYNR